MIEILVSSHTNRLKYTLDLIFNHLLGVDYMIIPVNQYQSDFQKPVINYTQLIFPDVFTIPNTGLLKENEIQPVDIRIKKRDIPYLFSFSVSASSYQVDFDLFSAVFYLVSDYEKYAEKHLDQYHRYDQPRYESSQLGLSEIPLVHWYCELLWERLKQFYPPEYLPERRKNQFSDLITFDIDFPWKYKYKGLKFTLGGLARDLVKGKWNNVTSRISTILTGKDPNDTYELIFNHCPPEKTIFFFLIDRNSEHDSRFTYQNPHVRKLIRQIREKGYRTGIHPSFTSYINKKRIQSEARHLEDIVEIPIADSRQHFLRYALPDTFRFLIEAGMKTDYTLCLFHTGGFPCGMARPFYWYDLENDTQTDLLLVPSIVMDRTLQQYMGLSPIEAVERIRKLRQVCQEINGQFTLLLHNDVLSEEEEWKGWREPILEILRELS